MHHPNFCVECGAQLKRKRWRVLQSRSFCEDCAGRLGKNNLIRPIAILAVVALSAFALGRYLRPAPPPLVIQRAANSPLSDLPINFSGPASVPSKEDKPTNNAAVVAESSEDTVYICGARTKKGTPCHRRVHFAGERCYQHKGMPSMLPLDKLVIK